MAQHFLLSRTAKTLSLAQVFRMSDSLRRKRRSARSAGLRLTALPVCPHCGGVDAYECRRLNGAPRFRCRACGKDFSITSGTLFASHKLPARAYLAAIAIFCNEVKGKCALALSPRSRRFLQVRLRSRCTSCARRWQRNMKGRMIGGEGKVAEVDGGYFGGYVKPHESRREPPLIAARQEPKRQAPGRRDRSRARRQFGSGRVPVRKPRRRTSSKSRIAKGTTVNADEAGLMGWPARAISK